jgi:hypothetical protein
MRLKKFFAGITFFRCMLSLRYVYIFEIYAKRRTFWYPTWPILRKKISRPIKASISWSENFRWSSARRNAFFCTSYFLKYYYFGHIYIVLVRFFISCQLTVVNPHSMLGSANAPLTIKSLKISGIQYLRIHRNIEMDIRVKGKICIKRDI